MSILLQRMSTGIVLFSLMSSACGEPSSGSRSDAGAAEDADAEDADAEDADKEDSAGEGCGANRYRGRDSETCDTLTRCTADEYESSAPTATSDRACMALTRCTANEYVSKAPTATSDRVCAAIGFRVISAGETHTCALGDVGDVTCWGANGSGESTVPGGLGTVVDVSSGGRHTCALDDTGTVSCWGSDHHGQSTVPEGLGTIVGLAASFYHTCVVDDVGAMTCWGLECEDPDPEIEIGSDAITPCGYFSENNDYGQAYPLLEAV